MVEEFNETLSIYIPYVNEDVTVNDITNVFAKNMGSVSRVDFIYNIKKCRQAFVHFDKWNNTNDTYNGIN